MIADVVFDLPGDRPFSYLVPAGQSPRPGQRVTAPLRGKARVGVVVAVRDDERPGLSTIVRLVDPVPLLPVP